MNDSIETFHTARLEARRISPAHLADLCRLHRDAKVMKTLSADGDILPDDVTREGLGRNVAHWEEHGFGFWIFHKRPRGPFVGRGGLARYTIDGRLEIGLAYAVVSGHWNQGFATEMAEASLRVGFDALGLADVSSWTLPINLASQRVMQKLGLRYERDFQFAGLPHRYYRLSVDQWTEHLKR